MLDIKRALGIDTAEEENGDAYGNEQMMNEDEVCPTKEISKAKISMILDTLIDIEGRMSWMKMEAHDTHTAVECLKHQCCRRC